MLTAIPVYLSISDGGFSNAACREMAIRSGAGDKAGVQSVFQSTWLLLLIISFLTVLLAFSIIKITGFESWLGFKTMNDLEIKIVFLLLVTHVLVCFQGNLLNGGFWATGHYPTGMYHIVFTQLIEFLGFSVVVVFGGGPIQAATGYLIGRIFGTSLMWIGQRRVCQWLRHGFIHASFFEIKRLAPPAFSSLAFPLGNALNVQGIRLIIGMTIGPSAVALFVPMRTLSRIVMQPGAIIGRLIQPELALAHGAGDNSMFQRIFTRSCQLSLWGCFGVCLLVGPGAFLIFPIWTGGMLLIHWPTYLILLTVVLINSLWYTALMAPYATNCHTRIAPYYFFMYGFTSLGFGYTWAAKWGIGGAALALLLAETTMAIVVIHIALPMARIGIALWAKSVFRPPFELIGKASLVFLKRRSSMSK